jgi:predicted MFS family arabinose efflux permease
MVAHCAGMVDLVALPVWVGSLMVHYRFDPQQAGGLATLFLAGAVLASIVLAPRFGRLPRRLVAALGFGLAALAFFAASAQTDFGAMAALHALAGLSAGSALSVTHGTIARAANPHRLFALVGVALGVFAIAFFATVPPLIASLGGTALFHALTVVMAVAAVVVLLAFPQVDVTAASPAGAVPAPPFPRAVWFGIVGIGCMGLVQAMTFAFVERIGHAHGFAPGAVAAVLVATSLVTLAPAPLAALLESRLQARSVLLAGPVLQAICVAAITLSTLFEPYAVATALLASVIIFTHTFAFGLVARLEPTGRALAATPAMVMTGAAIGPILGGTLVKTFGYGSVAIAACAIAAIAVACFSQLPAPAAVQPRGAIA